MPEPKLVYATLRDAVDDLHIECRFDDGQKFAAIKVDAEFPHLARQVLGIMELRAFAERVAMLNRDAGEIGAGMLASLVDEARRLTA